MIKRILFTTHRILGTLFSILFLIWFLTGFVMLYHTFPKITHHDQYTHADTLSQNSIGTLLSQLPDKQDIYHLKLTSFNNTPYLEVATKDSIHKIPHITPTYQQIKHYAQRWNNAPIYKVDTLYQLEQWIPFARYKKHYPIYKYHFADNHKTQLYLSSQTGEALQHTNTNSRLWAYLGAIPHWIYLTTLRQNTALWSQTIIYLSAAATITTLIGLILGIQLYIKRYRKNKKWTTPYTKFAYKWHHILGITFGIFVLTFVFSGMMSLLPVPQWIVKTHNPSIQQQLQAQPPIQLSQFKLNIQTILQAYPQKIKSIQWTSFGNKPLYKVVIQDKIFVFDASIDSIKLLNLKNFEIKQYLRPQHSENIKITLLNQYDNYYINKKEPLPLPIYKAQINDADNSTYYINPHNAEIQYYNNNTKARKWTYQALHSYKIPPLINNPTWWNITMWTTLTGGTLVTITGLWLAVKYLKRKNKKRKKHHNKIQKRNT